MVSDGQFCLETGPAKVLRWDSQPGLGHRAPGDQELEAGLGQNIRGQQRSEGLGAKTPRWESLRGCGSQWVGSLIPQPTFPTPAHTHTVSLGDSGIQIHHAHSRSIIRDEFERTNFRC